MTKRLVFGGSSDDTFGEITPRGDDYDNCASGEPIRWLLWSPSENAGMYVVGQYAPDPVSGWLVGIGPHDPTFEDREMPKWPKTLLNP